MLTLITKGEKQINSKKTKKTHFAVIDTETNWDNKVMSLGAVIADADTFETVGSKYYIITPEYLVGGIFSSALPLKNDEPTIKCSRSQAIGDLLECFRTFGVTSIFAYNAAFDRSHLTELSAFSWYDIMRLAAYRQYNSKIPACADCCKTGKLKRDYGVEPILRMLLENHGYFETHNALYDAVDELNIMRLLGHKLEIYDCALIGSNRTK